MRHPRRPRRIAEHSNAAAGRRRAATARWQRRSGRDAVVNTRTGERFKVRVVS